MAIIQAPTKSRRKKPKPNAAQRALAEEWERMMKKHASPLELGAKAKGVKPTNTKTNAPRTVAHTYPTANPPSVSVEHFHEKFVGSTAKPDDKRYTGTSVLGVSTMHKSSMVPVFSSQEAEEIAKMRRG